MPVRAVPKNRASVRGGWGTVREAPGQTWFQVLNLRLCQSTAGRSWFPGSAEASLVHLQLPPDTEMSLGRFCVPLPPSTTPVTEVTGPVPAPLHVRRALHPPPIRCAVRRKRLTSSVTIARWRNRSGLPRFGHPGSKLPEPVERDPVAGVASPAPSRPPKAR
jgi:hypothetical protein